MRVMNSLGQPVKLVYATAAPAPVELLLRTRSLLVRTAAFMKTQMGQQLLQNAVRAGFLAHLVFRYAIGTKSDEFREFLRHLPGSQPIRNP